MPPVRASVVIEVLREPVAATRGEQIVQVPDGREEVHGSVVALAERALGRIEVAHVSPVVPTKHAQGWKLSFRGELDTEVRVEGVPEAGEETELPPASPTPPVTQLAQLRPRHENEVDPVGHVGFGHDILAEAARGLALRRRDAIGHRWTTNKNGNPKPPESIA